MDYSKMTKQEIETQIQEEEKTIRECKSNIRILESNINDHRFDIREYEKKRNKFLEEIQEYANSIRDSLQFGRITQKTGTEEELESCQQTTKCMLECHSEAVRNKINCDLDIQEYTSVVTEYNTEIKDIRVLISESHDSISKMETRLCAIEHEEEAERIRLEDEKFRLEGGLIRQGSTITKCYFDGTTIAWPHFVFQEYSDNDMLEEWKVKVVSKCKELGINIQVYPKNSYCSELNGQWNFIINIAHDDKNYVYMIWRDANERVTYGSPICHPGHVQKNKETGRYEPDEFPLDQKCPIFKEFDRCIKDVFVDYRKIRDFARI